MKIEARLEELGFVLPAPLALPAGARLPFPWVRVRGKRVFISGHGPQQPDGSLAGPFGKVGAEVSTEQAYESARFVPAATPGGVEPRLGGPDPGEAWVRGIGSV